MTELCELSAAEIVARVAAGETSCRTVVEASLERIDQLDPHLNAFIAIDRSRALREADRLDAIRGAGALLPLHGVPIGVKDIIDVEGLPTTCHSHIMSGNAAAVDAAVVGKLRSAGAIIIGKTALHEFATGGPSFDLPWPPARNPWLTTHHPGGSSSGSAVSVAAGMVPAAIGTDTAGSVRHPATACGIVGFKPTYDVVSRNGIFPLAFSLDHIGSLAHSVADCTLLHGAMTGSRTLPLLPASCLKGLRVGVLEEFDAGADSEIGSAIEAAKVQLAHVGCHLQRLDVPPLAAYSGCGRMILQAEANAVHAEWLETRARDYGRRGLARLSAGASISAAVYIRAQQFRRQLVDAMEAALASVDVAICTSSLSLPCAIDDEQEIERTYDRQARTPFNLAGSPAISLPIARSRSGLPIGMQVVARQGDDLKLLSVAHALEQNLPWRGQRPDLSNLLHRKEP